MIPDPGGFMFFYRKKNKGEPATQPENYPFFFQNHGGKIIG